MKDLIVPEKFFLLAQHPEKGKFVIEGVPLQHGFAGSLLLEMSVEKRIQIDNKVLVLKPAKEKSMPPMSEIYNLIKDADKPKSIKVWINRLARRHRKYKWMVLDGMAKKRILRIEDKRFLGMIPYKRCYLTDRRRRERMIAELRSTVLQKRALTEENMALLGLIEACKMHKILATNKDELKTIRKKLKDLIKESPIAGSIDKTIKEVQGAIIVTMVAASVVTSSGSH